MKVAIMQPYWFPFHWYFRLMASVDLFVFADDVDFSIGSYVNRNKIKYRWFTVPVCGATPGKKINELTVAPRAEKMLKVVRQEYGNATDFSKVFPLVEMIVNNQDRTLSSYVSHSVQAIAEHIKIWTPCSWTSKMKQVSGLNKQDRVIDWCKQLGATVYLNLSGGRALYDPAAFKEAGIELEFLPSEPSPSILDDMMNGIPFTRYLPGVAQTC